MKRSSRLFYCASCSQQVVICSHCDRGNIYCGLKCTTAARQKYCKASNKRYQQTKQGRFNNALRQSRFRIRQANKVTDHSSQDIPKSALLCAAKNNAIKNVINHDLGCIQCCFCNKSSSNWLRHDFLRYYVKQNIKNLRYSRPP
jgi:hypothetical protein